MIATEAYRSAIGRYRGKARKIDKIKYGKGIDTTLSLFLITFVPVILYGLFITTILICSDYLMYFMAFLLLMLIYGYPLILICICADLLSITFRKIVCKKVLMRKSSLDKTLIPCKNLNTHMLDGRDRTSIERQLKTD